jgi:hypothetical protein
MKLSFHPLLPVVPALAAGLVTALAAAPAKPSMPDSLQRAREKRETLICLGNRIWNPAAIDTIRGLSREDKAFLRRRYQILHPLD